MREEKDISEYFGPLSVMVSAMRGIYAYTTSPSEAELQSLARACISGLNGAGYKIIEDLGDDRCEDDEL